jgi:hypothetical protein
MAEVCDQARMIQRVIDDKYPNTRMLWQSFQQQASTRPYVYSQSPAMTFNRSVPIALTRSWAAPQTRSEGRQERMDKVVQRVIGLKYPETRQIWIHAREEPAYLQTSAQRSRPPPRPPGASAPAAPPLNRPRTVPIPH